MERIGILDSRLSIFNCRSGSLDCLFRRSQNVEYRSPNIEVTLKFDFTDSYFLRQLLGQSQESQNVKCKSQNVKFRRDGADF